MSIEGGNSGLRVESLENIEDPTVDTVKPSVVGPNVASVSREPSRVEVSRVITGTREGGRFIYRHRAGASRRVRGIPRPDILFGMQG